MQNPMQIDSSAWDYQQAFSRNRGLISAAEQEKLRNSLIAIPGMGGVGGQHLMTLVRMGVERFRIADSDTFSLGNFNRQLGATMKTLGRQKATVLADAARDVNPNVQIDVLDRFVDESNVAAFLDGADLLVDGVDFFSLDARQLLFREARRQGIWAVTAGPLGFSTAWLTFAPHGMSFDDYFALDDCHDELDRAIAFALGLAPKVSHVPYFDFSQVDRASGRGPSISAACCLASGVVGAEAVKILLDRGERRPAPYFHQFDGYRLMMKRGKLRFGNRGPMQRLKRRIMRSRMEQLGLGPTDPAASN